MSPQHALLAALRTLSAGIATVLFLSSSMWPGQATAQQRPTVAIVMDGSGSMWGRLPGSDQPKFASAVNLLRENLATLTTRPDIAMVVFGQQRRGGCNAASTLLQPTPYSDTALAAAAGKLNPQGRGPLVLGLQRAAQTLANTKAPRSIVVVHDDPDNCSQDICAAATQLKQEMPDLRIFALTLNPKPANRGALACVSRTTGGRVVEIADQSDAAPAFRSLLQAALNKTAISPPLPKGTRPTAKNTPAAKAKVPTPKRVLPPTPGLMLRALLKRNGPAFREGLVWQIYRRTTSPQQLVHATTNAEPSIALPPGDYTVQLSAPGYESRFDLDVGKGPRTRHDVVLERAAIRLAAFLSDGGPVVGDASFTIRSLDETAGNDPLWMGLPARAPILLPPGRYRVTAAGGRAESSREFTVESGQTLDVSVPLQAGYLHVKTQSPQAPNGRQTIVTVETDDTSRTSGRRIVARSLQPNPSFLLPAGTYYVKADNGRASSQELVAIAPGKLIERRLSLPVMRLQVNARLKGSSEELRSGVRYRIWPRRKQALPPLTSSLASPQFELSPGLYRIECHIDQQNAVIVRDFEVTNAPSGRITLEFEAGTVALRIGGVSSQQDVFWQVLDPAGRIVWRTMDPAPRMTLLAGRYTVLADIGTQRARGEIVVESGRHIDIQVGRN